MNEIMTYAICSWNLSKNLDDKRSYKVLSVSIITVVYNRANVVKYALDSVSSQSYEIEHIVIDGGSDDGTLDIISKSAGPNTKIVSEPDEGIYDALNKGISMANGDVIGVLHSDDYFADPTVVEEVMSKFSRHDFDMVYGDLNYVTNDEKEKVVRHWRAGKFTVRKLGFGWMPPHPTLFVRRSVIERHGKYDCSFKIGADFDAMLRWFAIKELRVGYLPRVLVNMRVGGASNGSAKKNINKFFEDYRIYKKNKIGGVYSVILKKIRKLGQFFHFQA